MSNIPEQIERAIARQIESRNLIFTLRETDEYCLYNGGCFNRGKTPKSILREYIDDVAAITMVPGPKDALKPYCLTNSKKETILEMLKSHSFVSLDEFDRDFGRVCVKNGHIILNKEENEWVFWEHYPFNENPYKTFIQIPVDYDPQAECLVIDQFLTDVFGFNTVPLIYEFLAYVLMPTVKYQKAFLLYGPPSTGKTTFIDMIYKFFNGSEYFSDVRLQDLGEKFQAINMMHKLLNVFDDLPDKKMGDSYMFRQVVTNTYLRSEVKFVAEYVKWLNRIKLLFSCNVLTEVRKKEGDQFFRRWILIQCFNVFKDKNLMVFEDEQDPMIKEKDYNILEKICDPSEFSGLLNKILEAWIRLEERGNFPKKWNNAEYVKGLWQMDINPVKLFVDECCFVQPTEQEDYNLFYHTLNKFRIEHNAQPITKHACTQWLHQIDGIKKKKKGGGEYYYAGIGIKDVALEKYQSEYAKKQLKDSQLDDF